MSTDASADGTPSQSTSGSAQLSNSDHPPSESKGLKRTVILAVGALGVVYGDIGTSPLYTVKECFHGTHAIALTPANLLGVMSLIFWSLTMVVMIKYVIFILMADNEGEGGIYALASLFLGKGARQVSEKTVKRLVLLAIFGAALLYGDGIITPVISVLSAVEGLNVATSAAEPFVLPISCGVIFGLFLFQSQGTDRIGRVFGIIMLFWFTSIAALGVAQILRRPEILAALDPRDAVAFFAVDHLHGIVVLGAVGALYHRRRGPVCRSGSFRQYRHPAVLDRSGLSGPAPQLFRTDRPPPGSAASCRKPFLWAGAPGSPLSHGGPIHHGHGHRLPGHDLRRILSHPAGPSIGYCPRLKRSAYLRRNQGPNLYALGKHHDDDRLPGAGPGLQRVQPPGCGLTASR